MVDYNVTCPDYRYCEVKHTYKSPCEIWDCSACWWHYPNCTSDPEAPSDKCPYVKCYDLPRPSHSHTVTTIVTTLLVLATLAIGGRYVYRRFRNSLQSESDMEAENEAAAERVPLLQRCRNFISASLPSLASQDDSAEEQRSALDRFRLVIAGGRANRASPEVPEPGPVLQEREDEQPSAPPPPYNAVDPNPQAPIIRHSASLSVVNENFTGSRQPPANLDNPETRQPAENPNNPDDSVRSIEMRVVRMEEIPLSHSLD